MQSKQGTDVPGIARRSYRSARSNVGARTFLDSPNSKLVIANEVREVGDLSFLSHADEERFLVALGMTEEATALRRRSARIASVYGGSEGRCGSVWKTKLGCNGRLTKWEGMLILVSS